MFDLISSILKGLFIKLICCWIIKIGNINLVLFCARGMSSRPLGTDKHFFSAKTRQILVVE